MVNLLDGNLIEKARKFVEFDFESEAIDLVQEIADKEFPSEYYQLFQLVSQCLLKLMTCTGERLYLARRDAATLIAELLDLMEIKQPLDNDFIYRCVQMLGMLSWSPNPGGEVGELAEMLDPFIAFLKKAH